MILRVKHLTQSEDHSELAEEFAGWGKTYLVSDLEEAKSIHKLDQEKKGFLGEWSSTALCGNDITSSCLYVSALSLGAAGILAPVVLALVGLTLYFFRKIYGEVGGALPLNGGTYTLLLNTTSKKTAAVAACLTLLSYIATGVISANEAIHYIKVTLPSIPTDLGVISLLSLFAFLTILGIGESAKVALGIFILHITTLVFLIIAGVVFFVGHPDVFFNNISYGFSNLNFWPSLFFGFAIALLGISGFESSANFIEEQKPGVFPKTLKNMWLAVFTLNPLIALISLGIIPLSKVSEMGEGFLSHLGFETVGAGFSTWIAIDAFLVLSGAVLTSFIGVLGLVRRMSLDRCLPPILLIENKWRNTNHWIILLFWGICISIYFATHGKTSDLAGVYTLSFLSVMAFFAIGNILLKVRRARLPREEVAPWSYVMWGLILVVLGIIGNLILNPHGGLIFLAYYSVTLGIVLFLLLRTQILRFILLAVHHSVDLLPTVKLNLKQKLAASIEKINSVPVFYFSRGDTLASLNEAALYVLKNEQTRNLTICHIYQNIKEVPKILIQQVKAIDQIYPRLKIDLLLVKGTFDPFLIEALSKRSKVSKNRMFIGSPSGKFPHRIEQLGGVRVILGGDGL